MNTNNRIDKFVSSGDMEGLANFIYVYCRKSNADAVKVLEQTFFKLLENSDHILALQRFYFKAEEITVTHIPQCVNCKNNIDGTKCEALTFIPQKYRENKEDCPERIADND